MGIGVLLIFLLAMVPAALSLWQLRWLEQSQGAWMYRPGRSPRRFRSVRRTTQLRGIHRQETAVPEFRYVEGLGYLIGDLSCDFNARSPHMRCAVNPLGPCQGCRSYQAKPQ